MFKLLVVFAVCSITSSFAGIIGSPTAPASAYGSGVGAEYSHEHHHAHLEHEHHAHLEHQQPILKTLLPEYQHTQALLKTIDYHHEPIVKAVQPIHYQPLVKTVVAPIPYHHQYVKAIASGPIVYKAIQQAPVLVKAPVYLAHGPVVKVAAPFAYKLAAPVAYKLPHHGYGQNYHW